MNKNQVLYSVNISFSLKDTSKQLNKWYQLVFKYNGHLFINLILMSCIFKMV